MYLGQQIQKSKQDVMYLYTLNVRMNGVTFSGVKLRRETSGTRC